MKSIKIGNMIAGGANRPLFIFEAGINHQGNIQTAFELVDAAEQSQADFIKFQHHIPSAEMLESHPWYQLMVGCQLTIDELAQIKNYVETQTTMQFLCTPFSREAADQLDDIKIMAFKIGSGECNNIPFLKHVANKNKPLIISTGLTTREELMASIDAVREVNTQIILMNCTSNYPSTPKQTRLNRIDWLRSTFNVPVGQSDHTPTISTALGAIARGAVAIEKHVTLDKSADGPDHKVSLLPSEFKQMVDMGMEIWEGMRHSAECFMTTLVDGEQELRDIANHSVVTLKAIKLGEQFTIDNIGIKRPGTGQPASRFEWWLGKTAREDLEADVMVW